MSTPRLPLYERLPEIYRLRDAEQSPPGQLAAYLGLIDEVLRAVRDDTEGLYHNQFIETCDDWVVPYLGDLLGTSWAVIDWAAHPPGGESLDEFIQRTKRGLEQALGVPGEPPLLVAHGGTLRVLVAALGAAVEVGHLEESRRAILELLQQRNGIVRGREHDREARPQPVEHAENRRVPHRVRDRLDVELGRALVVAAARAAASRRGACRLPIRVDLDVRHGAPRSRSP